MLPDGRCLFRAIAHSACLRKGDEAPDDNRQRELADELRAQVSHRSYMAVSVTLGRICNVLLFSSCVCNLLCTLGG